MSATAHAMGENFHAVGDFLYRPDLAPDADRPVGKPSKVVDERLYKSANKTTARAPKVTKSATKARTR